MPMDILLAKAAGAATAAFEVRKDAQLGKGSVPVTLFLVGSVESGKAVTLEYNSEGTTWVQCKVTDVGLQLDATNSILVIDFPGSFRVSRAVDAGNVGVLIA
jgi:hypothetical protein